MLDSEPGTENSGSQTVHPDSKCVGYATDPRHVMDHGQWNLHTEQLNHRLPVLTVQLMLEVIDMSQTVWSTASCMMMSPRYPTSERCNASSDRQVTRLVKHVQVLTLIQHCGFTSLNTECLLATYKEIPKWQHTPIQYLYIHTVTGHRLWDGSVYRLNTWLQGETCTIHVRPHAQTHTYAHTHTHTHRQWLCPPDWWTVDNWTSNGEISKQIRAKLNTLRSHEKLIGTRCVRSATTNTETHQFKLGQILAIAVQFLPIQVWIWTGIEKHASNSWTTWTDRLQKHWNLFILLNQRKMRT